MRPARLLAAVLCCALAACSGQQMMPSASQTVQPQQKAASGAHTYRPQVWSGCGSGEAGAGCDHSTPPEDGGLFMPGVCATVEGTAAGAGVPNCKPGYWTTPCDYATGGTCYGTGPSAGDSDPCLRLPPLQRSACENGGSSPCMQQNSCLATNPGPAPSGAQCDGSPAIHEVGNDNLPAGSSSWGTTIANVYGFENDTGDVYAWVYVTENQSIWVQRNSENTGIGLFINFIDKAGLQGIANAILGSSTNPYQLNGNQWQAWLTNLRNSGFKVHRCYQQNYNGQKGA